MDQNQRAKKPGDKAKVKSIVKQWIKTNVLKQAEMYDKRQGRDVQCVVVGEMIKWDET
jgi:predicted XRE-type DNA-binding protein